MGPLTRALLGRRFSLPVPKILSPDNFTLFVHAVILFAFVAGATYAGTSRLFAAYLAGASISWWDAEFFPGGSSDGENSAGRSSEACKAHESNRCPPESTAEEADEIIPADTPNVETNGPPTKKNEEGSSPRAGHRSFTGPPTGSAIYERYYSVAVERILKPFFFVRLPIPYVFLMITDNSLGLNRLRDSYYKDV